MKSKMFEIAHIWVQAWENLFQRVASCEEERLCVLASLCLSTTLHLLLYWYKRNIAESTQKPILVCGEATLSTKLHRKHWSKARHPRLCTQQCLLKRWSAQVRRDTHEFIIPPHPHHEYSQKGSSLICRRFFSFCYKRGPPCLIHSPP